MSQQKLNEILILGKMNKLDLFSNELPNRIHCIPDYFIDESDLYSVLNK